MTEAKDYYRILGISEHAEADEIKRAYRALARACHPDHNPGDGAAAERFKTIREAYEVLSDPLRRQQYDLLRQSPLSLLGRFPLSSGFGHDGLDDAGGRPSPSVHEARQLGLEAELHLSFEQALAGGKMEVELPTGAVVFVTVPKGVRDGMKVRLKDRGLAIATSGATRRGDLYVTFRVAPSARFRREGEHLFVTETISALEAMLGTTRSIPSAYGQMIRLRIPPGTQPGACFRLRGQGVATCRRAGDLIVEVQVQVPRALTPAQRARLQQAAEEAGLL